MRLAPLIAALLLGSVIHCRADSADDLSLAGDPVAALSAAAAVWQATLARDGVAAPSTLRAHLRYLDWCDEGGNPADCLAPAAEVLAAVQALPEPERRRLLPVALRVRARLLNDVGQVPEAMARNAEALALGTADAVEHFRARNLQGVLLQNAGRFAESLALLDALLPEQGAALGERHPEVLDTQFWRARAIGYLLRNDEAQPLLEAVVAARTTVLGADHPQTLEARAELGLNQSLTGRNTDAVRTLEAASADAIRRLGAAHILAWRTRSYLAQALSAAGLFRRAVALQTELVEQARTLMGEQHPNHAFTLLSLGISRQQAGDAEGALRDIGRSHQLLQASQPPDSPSIVINHANLLIIRHRVGAAVSLAEAQPVVQRLGELLGPENPRTLNARLFEARLMGEQGDPQAALAAMQAVAEARVRLLGPTHREALRAQGLVGLLLARLGRRDEALAALAPLPAQLDRLRRSLAPLGAAAQRQAAEPFAPLLAEQVVLLAEAGRMDEAFSALEATQSRTLLEQLARQQLLAQAQGLAPAQWQQLQQLAAQRAGLESRASNAAAGPAREALLIQMGSAQAAFDAALAGAQQASPQLAALLDIAPARAADLPRLLPADTALLHVLKAADERWFALLSRPGQRPLWLPLGRRPGLADSAEALRAWTGGAMQDGQGRALRIYRVDADTETRWIVSAAQRVCEAADAPGPHCLPAGAQRAQTESDHSALRRQLGATLLGPVQRALGLGSGHPIRQLLISPDGALAQLPWDALQLPDGQAAMQRWAISLTPSLSVYQQLARLKTAPRGLLALAASDGGSAAGRSWPALPFAQHEARAAAALFRLQGSRALTGSAATASALRQLAASGELARTQRLLIAAHGLFDAAQPEANALLLGDGPMSVADWLRLPLHSSLVMLSACDSARGAVVAGEGLVGFAYALNVAGNRDLLATLWPVGDAAAAEFTLGFLKRVARGAPHRQALAQTRRAFAAQGFSPRVWAAYMLMGG